MYVYIQLYASRTRTDLLIFNGAVQKNFDSKFGEFTLYAIPNELRCINSDSYF